MRVTTMTELGVLIREERLRQKLTQTDLAGISGVGITFISQLENGKETAEMGRVIRVLTMLGIDLYAERRADGRYRRRAAFAPCDARVCPYTSV